MRGITLTCDPLTGLKLMSTVSTLRQLGTEPALLGLPGDFTPPSRFIRALAWTQTSRPTDGGEDTVHGGSPHPCKLPAAHGSDRSEVESCRAQRF